MTLGRHACPACGSCHLEVFHEQRDVPVNSCLLLDDQAEARAFPTGDLLLGWCPACGFITNLAFDPVLSTYSDRYEETQGFSPRFREFAESLAQRWVERHDIKHKDVLEIGCGKGEFLELLCVLGDNTGVGVDPSFVVGRVADGDERMRFIADFWSAGAYPDLVGDAIVCRHTLEHIQPVGRFVGDVRQVVGDRSGSIVLFELPDVLRVLEEPAFWDLYYEHCSYFSPGSLARLFRRNGFEVVDLWLDFDDQYILLEATPESARPSAPLRLEHDEDRLATAVAGFPDRFASHTKDLRAAVEQAAGRGGPVVIWGAGSKGVSFLSTLALGDEVQAAVDVNPHKQGRYLAGTGHRVVGPSDLLDDPPGTVFVMNGVYADEVRQTLRGLHLDPVVVPL